MVANLLNNAAKYTDPGGRIELAVEPVENSCIIRVRDTGIGISAEKLRLIFDMFVQVEPGLRSQGGLGIGRKAAPRVRYRGWPSSLRSW